MTMHINESAENYLETILTLSKRLPVVRSVDIANELDFKKSSVSVAMKNLRNNGLIEMDSDGHITLLEQGYQIAAKMYERHTLMTQWLVRLGVDPAIAAEDACKIEHVISESTFEALKQHMYQHASEK